MRVVRCVRLNFHILIFFLRLIYLFATKMGFPLYVRLFRGRQRKLDAKYISSTSSHPVEMFFGGAVLQWQMLNTK